MWLHRLARCALVAFAFALAPIESTAAASLIMVDWAACPHCQRFHREVEPGYSADPAGRRAALRRVNVLRSWPSDLRGIRRAHAAPVFILVDNGHEIGRFSGYGGRALFWRNLNILLSRM